MFGDSSSNLALLLSEGAAVRCLSGGFHEAIGLDGRSLARPHRVAVALRAKQRGCCIQRGNQYNVAIRNFNTEIGQLKCKRKSGVS
jgi:hypothetical protein